MSWVLLSVVLIVVFVVKVPSVQASMEAPVWKGDAPGTEGRVNEEEVVNERVRKVHQPSLTVHLPPRELSTGTAVLICPGGGYQHLAIQKEGHQVAAWLNTLGVAAFVLKYRLDRDEALQDVKEAMKVIRKGAEEWGVKSDQVGAMGFSAGGHLIVNLMLNSDAESRPNFLVPMYVSLRGLNVDALTAEQALPAFIVGASDDKTTPPIQAITLYQKLLSFEMPVELHLYEKGGHGFGLGKTKGAVSSWTVRCEDWLRGHGLLTVQ